MAVTLPYGTTALGSVATLAFATYTLRCQVAEADRLRDQWRDSAFTAEQRMESLVTEAHALADRKGLCSDYDDFMEELGLPRRERDYAVEVTVTTYVYITARDEDDAIERVDSHEVYDSLQNLTRTSIQYEIESAEESG